jgi:hypothetical protein
MHCPHGRPTIVRLEPDASRGSSSASEPPAGAGDGPDPHRTNRERQDARFAMRLAERFDAEIVGADSRQIYRDMPIGTAAPTAAERARVRITWSAFSIRANAIRRRAS